MHAACVPLVLLLIFFGDDEKTFELKLLPKAKVGQVEKIELEASVSKPDKEGFANPSMTGTLKRTIKETDGEGLASKEELELEKADFQSGIVTKRLRARARITRHLNQPIKETVTREGMARTAKGFPVPHEMRTDDLMVALRHDPDAFARLVEPEEKVAKGENWQVDPKDVLALLAPKRSKLSGEKSKARATLEALKNGEATVKLEATLHFTTPDEEDDEQKLVLEVTLHAAIDGSKPPRHERIEITAKDAKGEKTVTTIDLKRAWAEKEEDEDEDAKPEKKKDEKKKD